MKTIELKLPELGLFALTLAALGVGIGLLLSGRLGNKERRAAGIALLLVGGLTTLPFVLKVFGSED